MNKAKLVELADEVLTDIDVDMECVLRKKLEIQLCEKLSRKFNQARYHLNYLTLDDKDWAKKYEKEYQSVKPILDDSIDKLFGETK
tara:strand:- start:41 stop:298 length:258 start_codon:yes stop_codon:yes gene_type:complete